MKAPTKSKFVYDNSYLRGHITRVCGNVTNFAKKFGISTQAMFSKLSNRSNWSRDDIVEASMILGIADDSAEMKKTFFTLSSWEIVNND